MLRNYWTLGLTRSPAENFARLRGKHRPAPGRIALELPTINEWWELSRRYPTFRTMTHTLLKDYAYLRLLAFMDEHHPKRALEFGHGLWHLGAELLYTRTDVEMWACDDCIGIPYYPADPGEWEIKYNKFIKPFPQTRFVRCLVGDRERARDLLPNGYFDLVASVSVIEELGQKTLARVLEHAFALLTPGGYLIASHDLQFHDLARLNILIDAVQNAGFEWNVDRKALRWLNWDIALVEGQEMVMLYYLDYCGEQRRFVGNWTTIMVQARKPVGA